MIFTIYKMYSNFMWNKLQWHFCKHFKSVKKLLNIKNIILEFTQNIKSILKYKLLIKYLFFFIK